MYEDIVKEMKEMDKKVENGRKRLENIISNGNEKEENAKINEELKKLKANTVSIEEICKITGVKNGRRKRG